MILFEGIWRNVSVGKECFTDFESVLAYAWLFLKENINFITKNGDIYPSAATLWDILVYHKENSGVGEDFLPPVESGKEVVLVYAMRRISCPELAKVTLRTLGITGGKCMLR